MSFPLQIPLQNRKRFRLVTIACMAPLAPNTADIMSSSILALRIALGQSDPAITPQALAAEALSRANSNLGRNTYIHRDPAWTLAQAGRVAAIPRQPGAHSATAADRSGASPSPSKTASTSPARPPVAAHTSIATSTAQPSRTPGWSTNSSPPEQ